MRKNNKSKTVSGMTLGQISALVGMTMISCVLFIALGGMMIYYSRPIATSVMPTNSQPNPTATKRQISTTPIPMHTAEPTLSPMQEYSRIMQKPIENLIKWKTNSSFGEILNVQMPGWKLADGSSISYGNALVLLYDHSKKEGVPPAELSSSDMRDLYFDLASVARPRLQKDEKTGRNVLAGWNSIAPPLNIQAEHQQIVSCIQEQIKFYSDQDKWFDTGGDTLNDSAPNSPCDYYDQNLNTILMFVNSQLEEMSGQSNQTTMGTNTPTQNFSVQPLAPIKNYINFAMGLCLDNNANNEVYTLSCNGGNYQNWESRGENLVNVSTGFCLDSNAEGRVYAISCNGGDYQKWLRSDNRLINAATGLCLDSNANGNAYTHVCNGGDYQNWK